MSKKIIDSWNKICCFCTYLIDSTNIEPCGINILINFDKAKNEQYRQLFYCYLKCFENQLHEKMKFYLALEFLIPSSPYEDDKKK